MKITKISVFLIALMAATASHGGDTPAHDNESQLLGSAFMAVSTKGELVHSTLLYCAKNDASIAVLADADEVAWRKRNAKYLALAPILKTELHANAVKQGAQSQWQEFEGKTFPAQMDYVRNILVGQLKALPPAERKQKCQDITASIATGKLDFVNETQLIGYLDRRVAEQAKKKSK